jgi:hypothetical protein
MAYAEVVVSSSQATSEWHATNISIACSARMLSQARSLPFVPVWETECAFKCIDVADQERDLGLPSLKTDVLLDSLTGALAGCVRWWRVTGNPEVTDSSVGLVTIKRACVGKTFSVMVRPLR